MTADDRRPLDPAEEERDHLLASIEDLDREHAAGDLDDAEHDRLRAEYMARAAAVLAGRSAASTTPPAPSRRGRTAVVAAGVLAVAVLAGVAVARGAGQRGGGGLTGTGGTRREQLAACQPLAFSDPAKGVDCYQAVLDDAPDDLDALTYQGWARVRAGATAAGAAQFDRVVALDPDYPDVRAFRAVLAAREERWTDASAEVDRFYRNDPPPVAAQVLRAEGLEFKVFIGLQPPATRQCWVDAAAGLDEEKGFDQPFIDRLAACLDGVLAATPGDRAARFSRALASIGPERQDEAGARRLVEGLLAEDAADPDALLLKARLDLSERRVDEAAAAAAALVPLPRPTAAFLLGGPDDLVSAVEAARRVLASTTSTTPTASVSTVPGAPEIPNPGGG